MCNLKNLVLVIGLSPFFLFSQASITRLEQSPRHHEWVDVSYANRNVKSFLVYPEVAEKVPVIIVIHENRGLNDWARSMADQIAEAGYIALAPDLLSETAPNKGGTESYPNSDAARTAIYSLKPEQVTADLNGAVAYAKTIPASNGKVVVIGFCWGGSQSFRFATKQPQIETAIVCYGSGPKNELEYQSIQVPVYGFYGGNDNRVNATIESSASAMKKYGKTFEPEIYEGAGHGFFRSGEASDASAANKNGRTAAWERLKHILGKI